MDSGLCLRIGCKKRAIQLNTQLQTDTGYLHVIQLWLVLRLITSLCLMIFARLYCKENTTLAPQGKKTLSIASLCT